jgi:5-methyltetrahydropteroyltriglutamate--homocysteine methyltransferase
MNRVVNGFENQLRLGMHVCRGNWSKREDVLISGDYQPLVDCFREMHLQQLVLEYATPRAGDLAVVGRALSDREIGLGVCNPRTDAAESVDFIAGRIREALQYWSPEKIFLNPDCGFGCFANRCVNEERIAFEKLKAMVAAAKTVRAEIGN